MSYDNRTKGLIWKEYVSGKYIFSYELLSTETFLRLLKDDNERLCVIAQILYDWGYLDD